jgi:hypothetical protein
VKFSFEKNNSYNLSEKEILKQLSLKIESAILKTDFNISISFNIPLDSVFPYYFALKMLLKICERYGSNTQNLNQTIEKLLLCFRSYIQSKNFLVRRIGPKTIELISNQKTSSHIRDFQKLLENPNFKKLYNSFCTTAITIKKITTFFKFYDQTDVDTLFDFKKK